jgi:hypothetical protein
MNAIFLPSGDHTGHDTKEKVAAGATINVRPDPSGFITARPDNVEKAMTEPSGETAGHELPLAVSVN